MGLWDLETRDGMLERQACVPMPDTLGRALRASNGDRPRM